jgi:hypothetical protein
MKYEVISRNRFGLLVATPQREAALAHHADTPRIHLASVLRMLSGGFQTLARLCYSTGLRPKRSTTRNLTKRSILNIPRLLTHRASEYYQSRLGIPRENSLPAERRKRGVQGQGSTRSRNQPVVRSGRCNALVMDAAAELAELAPSRMRRVRSAPVVSLTEAAAATTPPTVRSFPAFERQHEDHFPPTAAFEHVRNRTATSSSHDQVRLPLRACLTRCRPSPPPKRERAMGARADLGG